jgi:threonine dehydrogenase-like Zn-dependent dehydrogenase
MGLVGNLAAQLYRIAGLDVRVWDRSEGRRRVAESVGFECVPPDAIDGVDVAVDAVGSGPVVEQCVNACAPYGEVVLLGSPRPPYETNLTATFNRIHMQWLTVRGALEWRLPPYRVPGGGPSVESNLALILDHIRAGRILTEGLVSHVIRPEGLLDAYRGMKDDPDAYHGVIVRWGGAR